VRVVRRRAQANWRVSILFHALLICFMTSAALGASWVTKQRSVTQVANGVYVIIHRDAVIEGIPQGNTTVIIGDRSVLVVDACFLTASAKEDIAEIRRLTTKPVRYLLNTHAHLDHTAGNSAYKQEFPEVEIIAQTATGSFMDAANRGAAKGIGDPNGRPASVILPMLRKQLQEGVNDEGKPLSAEEKDLLVRQVADVENEIADYRKFVYQPPTLLFSDELMVDLGNRNVDVKHLGRGHTPGDALAYLPQEKILITGDLLTWPIPYMRMSFPQEWVKVLRQMDQMDATTIVPGHGIILNDKDYLNEVIALLDSVISQVHQQAAALSPDPRMKILKVEDLHIDLEKFRKSMAGNDPSNNEFWGSIVDPGMIGGENQGVVGRTFAEELGKL
jgi:glyoxylase-like metal-dependent hydrolase (beta-lactamase superfamily II)